MAFRNLRPELLIVGTGHHLPDVHHVREFNKYSFGREIIYAELWTKLPNIALQRLKRLDERAKRSFAGAQNAYIGKRRLGLKQNAMLIRRNRFDPMA